MTENNEVKVDETSATAAPARKVLSLKPVAPLDSSRKTEDVSQTDPVKNVQKSISLNPPPPIKKPEAISSPAQNIQKEKNAAGVAASGVSGVHTADSSAISAKPQ